MSNNDKLLLTQGVATIKCQVIVKATDTLPEIVLSEENSVKDWTYTDERYVPKQGFIGQFVARTLSGNLQNISDDFNIEGREIELRIGVVSGTSTNWYSLGNFIITDPTDNNVVDNTKFEAMDYTKLFNKRFNGDFKGTGFTQSYNEIITNKGSVTALWLAKYCCAQVDVAFGQTTFTNSDFSINQNPFQAGETCRDVLKEISKLAYSWVRIGWDNKCYIDFEPSSSNTVSEENIITNNHYYTLETRKELYGPINNVVVGMSGIDGESHSEKDPNAKPSDGEHTIYIYDNPLTNTFELRALAQKKASKLFGLQFAQVSTETIGHPWLQANEKINVKNMENVDNYTYPFNRTIKFTGHIRTTIDSMTDSEIEATLAYESEIMKNIKKASATVDKQNGVINLLVDTTNQIQKEINPTKDESGSEIIIEDASNNPLTYLEIEGKSVQEIRNSTNKFNASLIPSSTGIIVNEDGSQIVMPTITAGNGAIYTGITLSTFAPELKVNDIVHMNFERNPNVNINTQIYLKEANVMWYRDTSKTITQEMLDSEVVLYGNRFHEGETEQVTLINFRMVLGESDVEWEQYGVSPSPEFPSEIESVGYNNFVKNSTISNLLLYSNYITSASTGDLKLWWDNINMLPVDTTLICDWEFDSDGTVVEYISGQRFRIDYTDGTIQTVVKGWPFVIPGDKTISMLYVYANQNSTYNQWKIIIFIKGNIVRPYIPYNKTGIEVICSSENLIDATYYTVNNYVSQRLILKPGTYTVHNAGDISSGIYVRKADNVTPINGTVVAEGYNRNIFTFTISELGMYYIQFYKSGTGFTSFSNAMLNKGTVVLDYKPYQKNTSLIVLNAPLRSLPNGVKDIAYIRNNKLYVDRYVGSVVLDGSEAWARSTLTENIYYYQYQPNINQQITNGKNIVCTHFKPKNSWSERVVGMWLDRNMIINTDGSLNGSETVEEFKTWLSINNVQVDYELATPVTEELGEIEMLKTLKGYNDILTTDELLPIINLTYVRDTILADYVENHIAELKITEGEIKESVEKVSTSVDGLNSTVNRVEEITNDNSQIINVISKNIITEGDKAGTVTEVTTTTGFTFNKDGMTIDDGSGFKAEHRADGTYYKDGETIVGQYTKDGSKQKDLQLFGVYGYGMKNFDDTPMFVGQLYYNNNGEECFGHFYNRGDY